MDVNMQSTSILPLELVERIVDFAGQESTKTCLLVSRQFHAGALRNIYRYQSLYLKARSDVLSKKYSRLFGDEENQFLLGGNRGRYVRKLSIEVGMWGREWGRRDPEYDEDIVLQLLEAFAKRTGLQELRVHGGGLEYKWDSLPLRIREGLQTLFQSSSLSKLSIQEFHDFPADILHGNKTLRVVILTELQSVNNTSGHPVVLPNATRLSSHYSEPVRHGLVLPHLRLLTAYHSTAEQRQASWVRINHAREALRGINMYDNENFSRWHGIMTPALPVNLTLGDFPELRYLSYAYEGRSSTRVVDNTPLLGEIIPFIEPTTPVPQFKILKLELFLDQWDGNPGEEFWMERKQLVMMDRSWTTLDTILTSQGYPNLEEVCIHLKIFNSILDQLDPEMIQEGYPDYTGEKKAFAKDIRDAVLGHLTRLKSRGVEVQVQVRANF